MNITKEVTANGKTNLSIMLSEEEVIREVAFVQDHFVDLGGEEEAQYDFRSVVMERACADALKYENLIPMTNPLFFTKDEIQEGKTFAFQAVFLEKPEFDLNSYSPVKIRKPELVVTEEMVKERIDEIRENYRSLEVVEGENKVTEEDTVEFEIDTVYEGKKYEPLCAQKRLYKLGEGFLAKEFDDALLGMRPGEIKVIEYHMDYAPDGNGSEPIHALFLSTVRVLSLYRETLPDFADAWVKKAFPELRTAAELSELVKKEIKAEQESVVYENQRQQAVVALSKRLNGHIPDELFEAKFAEFIQAFEKQARAEGLSLEEYLKQQKVEIGQFRMEVMLKLREQLKQVFALDSYAKHFNLKPQKKDYTEFFAEVDPERPFEVESNFELNGRMYIAEEGAQRIAAIRHLLETAV